MNNTDKLHCYASFLCEHYKAEMSGYKHLCHEPGRMEDPIGIKRCERKYCPKSNKTEKSIAKQDLGDREETMRDRKLHPAMFSENQIDWIEHLIRQVYREVDTSEYLVTVCRGILSTIEKSVSKHKRPLTEGKMLCGVKKQPSPSRRPSGPPGRGKPKDRGKKWEAATEDKGHEMFSVIDKTNNRMVSIENVGLQVCEEMVARDIAECLAHTYSNTHFDVMPVIKLKFDPKKF